MNQNALFSQHEEDNTPVETATCIRPIPSIVTTNSRERDHNLCPLATNLESVMNTKTDEADITQYICIDESAGKLVYSYHSDTLDAEAAESFEEHLLLCFRCQEIIFTLDSVFETLKANREEWFGPEERSGKEGGVKTEGKHKRSR